jgi:hypothetical protein
VLVTAASLLQLVLLLVIAATFVLTAVPDASVIDNIFSNVTDRMAVSTSSDGTMVGTAGTAGDSGNIVLTAVPDASVTDNIFSNIIDRMAVSTSGDGTIVGTAGIASSSGTILVAANRTDIEGSIIAASTTTTADVAKVVHTAVPDASATDNFFSNVTNDLVSPPSLDQISSTWRSRKSNGKPATKKYRKEVTASKAISSKKVVANNNCAFTNEVHTNSFYTTLRPKQQKYIDLDNYESTAVHFLKGNSSSDDMKSYESSSTYIPTFYKQFPM